MKALLTTLAIITLTHSAYGQSKKDYEAAINKYKKYYNGRYGDSIFYQLFAERMRNGLPLNKTREMVRNMHNEFGEIKSFEFIHEDERFRFYKTNFVKGVMTLAVALSPDKRFQSFRFVTYSADSVPK